ncbi:MAG: response regulator [Prolixibacteraceae bacterium]|nr:response regulator [Prolixibacteraceae bacterium]
MNFRNILICILILTSIAGYPQSRRFKHLTSLDGISQSEVYSFLKDSRGFVWFGTLDGLNRYDGYNIEVFNTNKNDPHSLSNSTVRSLAEDDLGRIWIGTDDGLNLYDPKTELISKIKINSTDKKLPVWSLLIKDGYLLVGTGNGLWRAEINNQDLKSTEYDFQKIIKFTQNQNAESLIRSIIKSKSGGVWIISSNNICRILFQQNSNQPVIIEDFTITTNQITATEDSTGNLWVASNDEGLFRYNPETKVTDQFNASVTGNGPSSRKCSSLALDIDGNLWIGTLDRGLNFVKSADLNKNKIHFESIRNDPMDETTLNSNLIYSLYVSNDNLLWVGTIGAGINIFNPRQKKFKHYYFRDLTREFPNSNFIRSVYADNQDRILTGTHANGLLLYNRKKNNFEKLGFGTESVFFISQYKDDKKFICSSSGLHIIQLNNNQLRILESTGNNAVFYVEKSKDNVYWIASVNGLSRIEIENNNIISDEKYTKNTKPSISENNCRVLLYDNIKNRLFVGTEGGGLNIITLDSNHYPEKIEVHKKAKTPESLSNNYIRSIIKDQNQNIWIGTYEGLNKMTADSTTRDAFFKTYTKEDGLPNNMIQLIVDDNNQNLWIGTNGGLSKFNPEQEKFTNYTVNDGLQSNEFSEHTATKRPDGEIILGGINGINAFYPREIKMSSLQPKTNITGFYLFNEKVRALEKINKKVPLEKNIILTDTIILSPKQKNIGFEFSGMMYPNANQTRYAYMLEGFDDQWHYTDASNRIANYTNLPHGEYTFKVKSSNPDGIWEESPKEIFLHIQTPFIFSWIAYILYVLIIVSLFIYFSHFTTIRYTTKKKMLLEKKHNEKLHELDVLRTSFFINISHDLRTPLTLIKEPLDVLLHKNNDLNSDVKEKLQLIKRNVKRLNYLIEQLLDIRKAEIGKLVAKPEKEDIVAYTKEEITHFSFAIKQKRLKLIVISNPEIIMSCFDKAMISKVYFNIISNAIKFTNQGQIEITLEKADKNQHDILKTSKYNTFAKVEIRDSGQGISKDLIEKIFNRFYQGKNESGPGYGIGLSHTKELIDAHEGYIEAESEEGMGTTIRFFLPETEIINNNNNINTPSSSHEDIFIDEEPIEDNESTLITNAEEKILIVEDNIDMRKFIKGELKMDYTVIEAGDGVEGLKKAKNEMPDLIVSDVKMPNMDGIELCDKLKSNIETSHIPLILLTAKVDLETKYNGIKTGADDYIPKPFEIEYLTIRIKNLLESRKKLRQRFQENNTLNPSTVTVNSVDEEFLSSLMAAIEEGIPNPDFTVNILESRLSMSHGQFYRKVKSITGLSGQELLFNMRMKRAYQILSEKKGYRIAEIAYMVGFTNPKYFSKCFKDTYGLTPSDVMK